MVISKNCIDICILQNPTFSPQHFLAAFCFCLLPKVIEKSVAGVIHCIGTD